MRGLAITHKGIEDVSAIEIKELINSKSEIDETVCVFDFKKLKDLALLCYEGQSFIKILYLIETFKFKDLKEIENKLNGIDKKGIEKFLNKKTFKVNCKRLGEHDFNSIDVEKLVTKAVLNKIKSKVDFETPDITLYAYIHENNFYLGIDFAGFDLSKRDYRIFLHPAALKGTIAYALLRTAAFKKGEMLLDPFCGSGTICIEAALFASDFSVNYYQKDKFAFLKFLKFNFDLIDKKIKDGKLKIYGYDHLLRHVKAAQKNSKIAGVFKKINLSKIDIEWMDLKFGESSVDKIVTHPPSLSKNNEKNMEKLYREFFHQAEFVLKKTGLIVLIVNKSDLIERISKEYKFKLINEKEAWQGQEKLKILVFSPG